MKIRQAIIPAAGLGSRFLPITKCVPKELLPLLDKPCIQHVIDEAILSGVEEFVIIISPEKKIMESYFKEHDYLNKWLEKRNQTDLLEQLKSIESKAKYHFVVQEEPLGLGHAVFCARHLIQDDYFMVLLPDDIIDSEVPVCQQICDVFSENKSPIISVMEVSWEDVHRYGIVKADPLSENLGDIKSIVEKPNRQVAPSNLAVIGRYLLPKEIFPLIEKTQPGAGGEIQLTDALKEIIPSKGLNSYLFQGERYDTGTPVGLLKASIALSLKHPQFKEQISSLIKILASGI